MSYAVRVILFVALSLVSLVSVRAEEVFTIKVKGVDGLEVQIPVPDGYKQLKPELVKKFAQDANTLAILVPVEDYAMFTAGTWPSSNKVIYIGKASFRDFSVNNFEQLKQVTTSEKFYTFMQQKFFQQLTAIQGLDKSRTKVEVKAFRDIPRSANMLAIKEIYTTDGSHEIINAFTDYIALGDLVLDVRYSCMVKAGAESLEVVDFLSSFIDRLLELNPEDGYGVAASNHAGSVATKVVTPEQTAIQDRAGSARVEEETKKFVSADFSGIFPFEFAFRYPRRWNNFEFQDHELVSSSKDTRMRFASYVNIEYLVFNGLKPLMQSNSEEMERHLIRTVLENSEEKKEFPNCSMTVDIIGNYPVGVLTLDYAEMKRGRKLFFPSWTFCCAVAA